jgi:uncharacterized protein (TIGR00725 family)
MDKSRCEKNYANRLKIVGVFGGGEPCDPALAIPVGELIARKGFHLLTGGGGGVMSQVSEAFYNVQYRTGLVIGIIRAGVEYRKLSIGGQSQYCPRVVNDWVEVPVYTHLRHSGLRGKELDSRNPINALTSDLAIVLPGGEGTSSEVELALEYGIPVVFFLGDGKVGKNDASYYRERYPKDKITEARSISDVETELSALLSPKVDDHYKLETPNPGPAADR